MTHDEYKAGIAATLGVLVEMYKGEDIMALSVAVVRKNGDIRTFQHHADDFKFPLLSATDIAHNHALDMCRLNVTNISTNTTGPRQ